MSHKIILDTDPGIDDAMALFTALAHPAIDLIGVTTTFGNVAVSQATRNALTLLEMAQASHIPVAQGGASPWIVPTPPFPDFVHGADGFGNLHLPLPTTSAITQPAPAFMVEQILKHPHEITIVAIGPLDNLATALQLNPEIAQLVKQVVIMGGAIEHDGNVSPVAEANIYCDPHAAEHVMAASWPVVMVGLDVTHQVILDRALFERIRDQNPRVGQFMYNAVQFYMRFYGSIRGIQGCYGHDISAVAYVIDPTLFQTIEGSICVATEGVAIGQTIIDRHGLSSYALKNWNHRPKQKACVGVDAERLRALFESSMTNEFWGQ
ncbi:nucleoside hydrolase [Thiofilum flexile]|uniref:nucleoside hydrolase n=1 Tax=Thiofilum flexile TaxID=125627 RepID=UPI0003634982|nr:nucleoside hydrolase [Thiofilum flexile]